MKRWIMLILTAALLFGLCAAASAEDGIMPLDSDYFTRYGISLSPVGDGNVEILFSCSSVGVASQLGVSTYSVQRWDGSNWEDVTGPLSGSTGRNVSTYSFTKLFHGVPGESYRVTCGFLCVKSDATSETKTFTSVTVRAKSSTP